MTETETPQDSARPEVIVTGPPVPSALEALEKDFTVHRLWEAGDRDAFLARLGHVEMMASTYGKGVDAAMMDALPGLRLIAHFGVGTDNIDLAAAAARDIRVTNTPGVLDDAVAEMTLALMLALARRVVDADRFVRAGLWPQGNYPLTAELTGRTLGILGLGRIGKEIARRAQVFGMRVVYHGRTEQKFLPWRYYSNLIAMARDVDWLVCVVPGNTGTAGLVSRPVLEALGPKGCLVNMGRGSLVDEVALLELLKSGELGGAALDVFADEPRMDPAFFGLPNVVLSPHQGSATEKTRWQMGDLMVRNLLAWRDGRPLPTPVV